MLMLMMMMMMMMEEEEQNILQHVINEWWCQYFELLHFFFLFLAECVCFLFLANAKGKYLIHQIYINIIDMWRYTT